MKKSLPPLISLDGKVCIPGEEFPGIPGSTWWRASNARPIEPIIRASGDCVCEVCGKLYRKHPYATEPENLGNTGDGLGLQPYLHRLCDGTLVKL